jgi:uncharacterized protein
MVPSTGATRAGWPATGPRAGRVPAACRPRALQPVRRVRLRAILGVMSTPSPAPASRPPLPPFTRETAERKVQAAEDAWNTRDPQRVALAYTEDTRWRNRSELLVGRAAVVEFLTRKWRTELDYALRKQLWAFTDDRIAVRFQYEWHDDEGRWWRSYGNEQWEFTAEGLMRRREASINDVAIDEGERRIRGPRPEGERDELPMW